MGRWRDTVDGEPADAVGKLPDGSSFDGIIELSRLLGERTEYKSCVTRKLLTYALGRTASNGETCLLDAIGEEAVAADSRFSDLLWAIVTSDAFQRAEAEAP